MKTSEVGLLTRGTVVYEVFDGKINSFWIIGFHPKCEKTLILGSRGSVSICETRSYHFNDSDNWETDYDIAKEKMWHLYLEKGNSLNDIYFNGSKHFKNKFFTFK